ncbi:hypothetical protein HHK36_033456 [Tetracentron sinense]|uniref:Bifunctional inhibitor/plant lipid transfer protein/seed storage helical domain-containing protein n=1 Tax=Tetracentron sinense TaxID=13715 RepID=A0A835CWN7_TETSI|nr:hypothetical protein HHK36_033456 [Tetracentron sinense]
MESNLFLSLIIFSSWILGDFSETIVEVPGDSMPCMQKLLPCQPYLLSSSPPSTTCCIPLKGMIANDPKCLCDIFDNPVLLKNLNITQDDALKLTTACGAKVDISVCKNAMAPATSPATPMSPTSPSKEHRGLAKEWDNVLPDAL